MPNLREIDLRVILKKYYPVVFLLIVFAVCVDLLGMVWKITEPLIAGGERDAIVAQLNATFPAEEGNEWVEVEVTPDEGDVYSIYIVVVDENITNFSFVGVGSGRNGDIRTLLSFNYEVALGEEFDPEVVAAEAKVEFVFVIKHVETPGIGELAMKEAFTDTFIGLLVDEIGLPPDGDMDIITGATDSSKALIGLVREEAAVWLALLPTAEDIETAVLDKRAAAGSAE